MYTLKDWCDINNQQQQQFHHQALHQKGGWNNFGPIADWTSIDPAIVSSSRPLPFQTTSTWQFPHVHPPHTVSHNAQQVLNTFLFYYTLFSKMQNKLKNILHFFNVRNNRTHQLNIGQCNHLQVLLHQRLQDN